MYWGIDTCGWALMRCCQVSIHIVATSRSWARTHTPAASTDWRSYWPRLRVRLGFPRLCQFPDDQQLLSRWLGQPKSIIQTPCYGGSLTKVSSTQSGAQRSAKIRQQGHTHRKWPRKSPLTSHGRRELNVPGSRPRRANRAGPPPKGASRRAHRHVWTLIPASQWAV